jgi:hypothetical protein
LPNIFIAILILSIKLSTITWLLHGTDPVSY